MALRRRVSVKLVAQREEVLALVHHVSDLVLADSAATVSSARSWEATSSVDGRGGGASSATPALLGLAALVVAAAAGLRKLRQRRRAMRTSGLAEALREARDRGG